MVVLKRCRRKGVKRICILHEYYSETGCLLDLSVHNLNEWFPLKEMLGGCALTLPIPLSFLSPSSAISLRAHEEPRGRKKRGRRWFGWRAQSISPLPPRLILLLPYVWHSNATLKEKPMIDTSFPPFSRMETSITESSLSTSLYLALLLIIPTLLSIALESKV